MKGKTLLLYAITDRRYHPEIPLSEQVKYALEGGVTCLQLREKNISDDDYIKAARELLPVCHRYNVPLIINDNPLVAAKSGADGVHVGIEDEAVSRIREIYGKQLIVGATAKTVAQARKAEEEGADYLGVGAVFPSPTKTNALRITPEQLREITRSVSIPAVAIGGINESNAMEIANCGESGIAVVSAIFGAEDISAAAGKLKLLSEKIAEQR